MNSDYYSPNLLFYDQCYHTSIFCPRRGFLIGFDIILSMFSSIGYIYETRCFSLRKSRYIRPAKVPTFYDLRNR